MNGKITIHPHAFPEPKGALAKVLRHLGKNKLLYAALAAGSAAAYATKDMKATLSVSGEGFVKRTKD